MVATTESMTARPGRSGIAPHGKATVQTLAPNTTSGANPLDPAPLKSPRALVANPPGIACIDGQKDNLPLE
jgi:hypothetical protein